ncbi:hypothetical protein [Leptospira kanakyensis]|uniref:hypothetical protein n=1 Tax=Leptospira kanakyensis TaxID=2484968 RepID=UPI00223E45C7|nr:hypothetical protein [Leptospira kanakyensis]MCW7471703.1 hypothetical protein [Leptospira kanakyensis]
MDIENSYIIYSPQYSKNQIENCKNLKELFKKILPEYLKNEGENIGLPDHIFIFSNSKKLEPNIFLVDRISFAIKQNADLNPERHFIAETNLDWYFTDTYKRKT